MRSVHATALAAATILTGCSQPLMTMQLDIPQVAITSPRHDFLVGNPANYCQPLTPGCVYDQEQFDIGAQVPSLNQKGVTFDLRLTEVGLHLVSGTSNLNGILKAEVKLQDPATGDWTVIASYVRPANPTSDITDITVSGNPNIPLAPFVSSGLIGWHTEVTYDTSTLVNAFQADVRGDFSLTVTMDYDAYL